MVLSKKVLSSISIYVFLVLIPYSVSLSFSFAKFRPEDQNLEIVTEGDGPYISNGTIQLTGENQRGKVGRARYIRPLHLWDNVSGELANFTSNFSYVIYSSSRISRGQGLTFFLASNNSVIMGQGALGLPVNSTNIPFVAVEFDTYFDSAWDPGVFNDSSIDNHVGIDVNSLSSVRFGKWVNDIANRRECHAWIKYDSASKNLSVVYNGFENETVERKMELQYTIDMRKVLPEWVIIGFSAATGYKIDYQDNNIRSWNFTSSDLQIDQDRSSKGKNRKHYVVGLLVVLCVLVLFLVVLAFFVWRRKKKTMAGEVEDPEFVIEMNRDFDMGTGPKRFAYNELVLATTNFVEKLGEGGFGGVYKGVLSDLNTYVAVKRVSKSSKQGIKEYASEVKIISRLRHRNLVQLIGWCHEKEELILVYEYLENGSLDSHLFKAKSLLTWETRYKIAQGIASALLYLHEEWEQCVLHRDIKSSNVMLDSNFNAKLGDFGLAKLVDHDKGWQTTMLGGTMGYMAPECATTRRASKKSDVYSFGIVALEIACGRKPIENKVEENQISLVEWVWGLYGTQTLLEAVDPLLGFNFIEEEIKCLMIVGLWCANPDSKCRPSIKEVINVLNFDASLPTLPSTMPVATYFTPPQFVSYSVSSNPESESSSSKYKTDSSTLTSSSTVSSSLSPFVALLHSVA